MKSSIRVVSGKAKRMSKKQNIEEVVTLILSNVFRRVAISEETLPKLNYYFQS